MKFKERTEKIIAKFNKMFPVGSTVRWRSSVGSEYQNMTVAHAAYDNHGLAVAFFNEKSGFCSVEPLFVDYPDQRG